MKSRPFSGKFFVDPYIQECTLKEKIILIYYMYNERVNWIGCYEVTDKTALFEIGEGLSDETLNTAKQKFMQDSRLLFIDSYVIIKNNEKYDNHLTNVQLMRTALKQFKELPDNVKGAFFDFKPEQVSIAYKQAFSELEPNLRVAYSVSYTVTEGRRNKEEGIMNKEEGGREKEEERKGYKSELLDILSHFNQTFEKNFTSKGFLDNFVLWRKEYSVDQIKQAITNWKNNGWFIPEGQERPDILFRTKNKNGQCDYIGDLLNSKRKSLVI